MATQATKITTARRSAKEINRPQPMIVSFVTKKPYRAMGYARRSRNSTKLTSLLPQLQYRFEF